MSTDTDMSDEMIKKNTQELKDTFDCIPELDRGILANITSETEPEDPADVAMLVAVALAMHKRINEQGVAIEKLRKALVTAYGNSAI